MKQSLSNLKNKIKSFGSPKATPADHPSLTGISESNSFSVPCLQDDESLYFTDDPSNSILPPRKGQKLDITEQIPPTPSKPARPTEWTSPDYPLSDEEKEAVPAVKSVISDEMSICRIIYGECACTPFLIVSFQCVSGPSDLMLAVSTIVPLLDVPTPYTVEPVG